MADQDFNSCYRGIVLLALERAPEEYSHHLNQISGAKSEKGVEPLQILDCFSDPLGWHKSSILDFDSCPARTSQDGSSSVSPMRAPDGSQSAAEAGPSGRNDASQSFSKNHGKLQSGVYLKVHFGEDESLEGLKMGIQKAGEGKPPLKRFEHNQHTRTPQHSASAEAQRIRSLWR